MIPTDIVSDAFPWESEEQCKGWLSFVKYLRQFGGEAAQFATPFKEPAIPYIFQKMHEAHEWWSDTLGNQVSDLQDQIHGLQQETLQAKEIIDQMKQTIQAQNLAIEQLLKSTRPV